MKGGEGWLAFDSVGCATGAWNIPAKSQFLAASEKSSNDEMSQVIQTFGSFMIDTHRFYSHRFAIRKYLEH